MIPDQKGQTLRVELELMQAFRLIPRKVRNQGEEAIILFLHGTISRYLMYFYAILGVAVFANIALLVELFSETSFVYGNDPTAERLITFSPFVAWVLVPLLWRERAMRFKDLLQVFERNTSET